MDQTKENDSSSRGKPGNTGDLKSKNDYRLKKPVLGFRDLWELILKVIIAALIIIFWFTYIMKMNERITPLAWIIFILIILVIIFLIWRQRHFCFLKCSLTGPTGCIQGFTDVIPGRILEPVTGSAHGWGFDHYIIEVRDPNGNLMSDVVIYANGSGSPDTSLIQGTYAKVTTTLGWIDVEKAANDAGIILLTSTTFEVTLRVFCLRDNERCGDKINFSLEANEVFIKQAGGAISNDYPDPSEPLKRGDDTADPATPLATIGGSISIRGSAMVYGCAVEKIAEYSIWIIKDDGFSFAQPATNDTLPSPTPSSWKLVTNIKFNGSTGFTPDDERLYNPLNGDPYPDILTNHWGTRKECFFLHIDSIWKKICYTVPSLIPFWYDSSSLPKLSPLHHSGTGKFTILLQVVDTLGNRYYDIQRAWIDNEGIVAKISGIGGLPSCKDLFTKDSAGKFITVQINGNAWDQLIDPADPAKPTSDNFGGYYVYFNKQGALSGWQLLKSSTDPVPARPSPIVPVDPATILPGNLTDWKLNMLDKASNPDSLPLDQLLDPGEGCTYDIYLHVWDKTLVSEYTSHHSGWITFPVKIINAAP